VLGIATSTLYEKLKKYGFPGADLAPTPHRK
jgi:DNA-binding NtrC family response regulator